eukprot:3276213-Prorocentrum_lima.AAC.1
MTLTGMMNHKGARDDIMWIRRPTWGESTGRYPGDSSDSCRARRPWIAPWPSGRSCSRTRTPMPAPRPM